MRKLLAAALIASVVFLAHGAGAQQQATETAPDQSVIFGLTATQLAIAAVVGAAVGTGAAVASGNSLTLATAGLGTLAAIYVAHLFVEAIVVGGLYYFWPWEEQPEDDQALTIRGEPPPPMRPTLRPVLAVPRP